MRVLLAGGGSGGSATPVLAVAQALRRRVPGVELLYVGTRDGPEASLATAIVGFGVLSMMELFAACTRQNGAAASD